MAKQLTAEVPGILAARPAEIAVRLNPPAETALNEAVVSFADIHEERHKFTDEALADVDAGHRAGHTAVKDWAARPGKDNSLPVPLP